MNYQTEWVISFYRYIVLIGFIFSTIFYTLIPGTLLTLPNSGSKNTIYATHTGLFMCACILLIVIFTNSIKNIYNPVYIISLLYLSTLFYALLPGVFMTIPNDNSKTVVNLLHSSIFGIIIAVSFIVLFAITSGR